MTAAWTLPDIVRRWARATPDRPAVTGADGTLTYAELDGRSSAVAQGLLAAGISPGDHVGYLGPNTVFFWVAWFGAAKAGAVLTPVNWRFAVPELLALVDDAEFPVVFAAGGQVERLEQVRTRAARPFRIMAFGAGPDVPGSGPIAPDVDAWLAAFPDDDPSVRSAVALMSYTSGTTGRPKGVQITHQAFERFFAMSAQEPTESWSADDVLLMVMPNFHLAGSWLSLPALFHGGSIAVLPAFDPGALFAAIARHRPTVTCLVPAAIELVVRDARARDLDMTSLRRILYAGSPIRPQTIRLALEILGCDLVQFYGTTETYIITLLRPEQHRSADPEVLSSCGRPFPQVEIRVVGPDGTDVGAGDSGEVLVRSPTMFAGYWKAPAATAAVLVDGWYHTGDVGRLDAGGNLRLLDRLDDMIVTGGENVYSAEVEAALGSHPRVQAVAVVGVPDPTWGQAVTAYVVATPDEPPAVADLITHCRSRIAGYKVPKTVHLVDELPLTASGKVQKHVVRALRRPEREGSR